MKRRMIVIMAAGVAFLVVPTAAQAAPGSVGRAITAAAENGIKATPVYYWHRRRYGSWRRYRWRRYGWRRNGRGYRRWGYRRSYYRRYYRRSYRRSYYRPYYRPYYRRSYYRRHSYYRHRGYHGYRRHYYRSRFSVRLPFLRFDFR